MLRIFGGRRTDEPRRQSIERLKAGLRLHLRLAPEDGVSVSEIECRDPACPGSETVMLVMREGRKTVALKITKPADEIDEADISALSLPATS